MPGDPITARAELSVLDLVPIAAGSTAGEALHRSIDLARAAEAAGYARYWLAEHHLNPGVAGSAPHVFLGILAASTERIRVGTAATIVGNSRPLQIAEAAGTVAALYPGRVDLGFGRSGLPPAKDAAAPAAPVAEAPGSGEASNDAPVAEAPNTVVDGLVVPPARPFRFDRARFAAQARLLGRVPGDAARFAEDVDAVRAFLAGPVGVQLEDGREGDGAEVLVDAQPATGADVQFWVHGSSAGESARLAGRLGLRFGTNYHVAPSGVLDAVAEYRRSFRPSAELERPHVIVSVDVVVAETDAEAERLAAGYAEWVLSIREGAGAVPYPAPEQARPLADFAPAELAAVRDRLDTRFVGSPATVVAALETLQRVTGADELLVTTIVHDHELRVASYRLLAEAWRSGAGGRPAADGRTTADTAATGLDRAAFARDWETWHRAHEAARAAEHGFLAVTGLHWLGSEPARFPGTPGAWSTGPGGPVVELDPGEVLELDGAPLEGRHAFGPVPERGGLTLRSGPLAIELARRGGRDLVRPRDPAFPFRAAYPGTPSYLPNPRWLASGRFVPFDEPEQVTVDAAVEGQQHVYEAPGRVEFELRGEPFALTVFNGATPGSLFALFTDATSGLTTYAANRSLAIDAPDEDGAVQLDFNRAVNLPCAYTDFATCPLPPAGNRLPIGIEAGEKTPLARQGA
ncbi:LLM class flavin-dependent oxidoreductase [Agromyces mediolanus]|uniref:LLM class flavin-dependent oxidoreductase n=1 Tax=Agromyces mediolanus TaxID=41986 RepID=UPI00383901DC